MRANERLIPRRRFKEFVNSDAWEQRKWSETVNISTEMVDPRCGDYDNLPHVAPGNIESFTGQLYDNVKSVKEENLISGKFRFRESDVIYGKINPQLGKYVFATFEGLTSADAYVLNAKNNLNQKFLFALLQTNDFFNYSVSVSKRSGMPKINRSELNAYSFYTPLIDEQDRIGSMFLKIDNLITLHQRKLEKMNDLKSAYLSEMFPAEGDCKPKRRFAGFTDDWEQRELGEITSYESSSYSVNQFNNKEPNGEYPLFDANNLVTLMNKYDQEEKYISIIKDGAGVGRVQLRQSKSSIIGTMGYIINKDSDLDFIFYIFQKLNIFPYITGSTIPHIYYKDYSKENLLVPSLSEQKHISRFFKKIDTLITLHQRKLEKLKNIKKAYLNEMFI